MNGKRTVAVFFLTLSLLQLGLSLYKNRGGQQDFATDYYAAKAVVFGKTYDGKQGAWIYPKAGLLQFVPLAHLSFDSAQTVSTIISLVSLFLSLLLLCKECRLSLNQALSVFALASLAFPVKFALGMGQINLYILLLTITSWMLVRRGKFSIAGAIYGISLLIKPILVLPLLVLLLKKRFKVLFWTVVVVVAGLVAGGQNYLIMASNLSGLSGKGFYYNQSLLATINRLVSGSEFQAGVYLFVSLILLGFLYLKPRFDLAIIINLLLFPVVWQHSLVFLAIPLISLAKQIPAIILLGAYLLIATNIKNSSGINPIILSHGTWGMLLLLSAYLWKMHSKIVGNKIPSRGKMR